MTDVGVVVIGRNEGARLRRCLESIDRERFRVVYVDSGSTDGSLETAAALAVPSLALDTNRPFTAARARNAGARHLMDQLGEIEFLQFVDGDCELAPNWIDDGVAALRADAARGAVCGRLRERERDATVYNRLADMEWAAPPGPSLHCGGIAMYRSGAWLAAGGFDETLIAGEEPELCRRLRAANWTIWRVEVEMARHDIAMTRVSQWWTRCVRSGFVYAEGAARHGRESDRYCVRELRSILLWAGVLPALAVGAAWPTSGLSLLLLAAYGLLFVRILGHARRRTDSASDAALFSAATIAAKFAQLTGVVRFVARRLTRGAPGLIESARPDAP